MNLPTLIAAALLALCLGLALRSIWRGRGGGCACCKRGCPHGAGGARQRGGSPCGGGEGGRP